MDKTSPALDTGLALTGSILMFIGWLLAIVPPLWHGRDVIAPLVLAIIGFGIVLVPAGLEFFGTAQEGRQKRGVGTLIISLLPAVALFLIVVAVFPLSTVFRILSPITEFVGMAVYGWAFWEYNRATR